MIATAEDVRRLKKTIDIGFNIVAEDIKPVRNAWQVLSKGQKYFLKKIAVSHDEALFVCKAMEHLRRKGFGGVPGIVPARSGSLFFCEDDSCYILQKWIEAKECDYIYLSHCLSAASALGLLHSFAKGYVPPALSPQGEKRRIRWGSWKTSAEAESEDIRLFRRIALRMNRDIDSAFLMHYEYSCRRAKEFKTLLDSSRYYEICRQESKNRSFCHHDLAHHNILIDSNGNAAFVDFDYCVADIGLHDLGSLLIRSMRMKNWNYNLASEIVEAYEKGLAGPGIDRILLAAFLTWPKDYWQIGYQLYVEKQPWPDEVFGDLLRRKAAKNSAYEKFMAQFLKCL